jgi:hypothetical protein
MMRLRAAGASLTAAALLPIAVALLAALVPLRPLSGVVCAGSGPHHAALVVEHADGRLVTRCVAFSAAQITGEQLLARSGIEYATVGFGGFGDAVCQIDGEPASFPASCWTSTSPYWIFFVARAGGTWSSSSLGVTSQVLRDGDAAGFRYESQSGPPLAPAPATGVCAASIAGAGASATWAAVSPAATVRLAVRPTPTFAGATPRPSAAPSAVQPTAPWTTVGAAPPTLVVGAAEGSGGGPAPRAGAQPARSVGSEGMAGIAGGAAASLSGPPSLGLGALAVLATGIVLVALAFVGAHGRVRGARR